MERSVARQPVSDTFIEQIFKSNITQRVRYYSHGIAADHLPEYLALFLLYGDYIGIEDIRLMYIVALGRETEYRLICRIPVQLSAQYHLERYGFTGKKDYDKSDKRQCRQTGILCGIGLRIQCMFLIYAVYKVISSV